MPQSCDCITGTDTPKEAGRRSPFPLVSRSKDRVLPSTDHITVAWGRDYSDVAPIRGMFVGGGQRHMTVAVDVVPYEAPV